MCGIYCSITTVNSTDKELLKRCKEMNELRGPDKSDSLCIDFDSFSLDLSGFVLHLRGNQLVPQPIVDSVSGDVFLWNGEVFGGIEIPIEENDTELVFNLIQQEMLKLSKSDSIYKTISKVEGPYSFLYFDRQNHLLHYGRDFLGRRSLLIHFPTNHNQSFILSSVAFSIPNQPDYFMEVGTEGFYTLDLKKFTFSNSVSDALSITKWNETNYLKSQFNDIFCMDIPASENELLVYSPEFIDSSTPWNALPIPDQDLKLKQHLDVFDKVLASSIQSRINNIPQVEGASRIGILFSGGLDCSVLAALVDRYLPSNESIDLFNVAFENPRVLNAQKHSCSENASNYNVPDRLTGRKSVFELRKLSPTRQWNFIEINVPYSEYILNQPFVIDLMRPNRTVMDLSIAMAFWFASRGKGNCFKTNDYSEIVPFESRCKVLFSGLGADEMMGGYSRHRSAFESPFSNNENSNTNIDYKNIPHLCPSRYNSLLNSIREDINRLPTRNLSRDDRLVSSHGKEVRFPFLSHHVVNHLNMVPVKYKCDFRYERGYSEKVYLRIYAMHFLGLTRICVEKKRAVQFGAKTAKLKVSSEKGNDLIK